MVFDPVAANAELARMRASSGPRMVSKSGTSASEGYDGVYRNIGSAIRRREQTSNNTQDEIDLRDIERRIDLGLPFDAKTFDRLYKKKLITSLPENYSLSGGKYVMKRAKAAIKTKSMSDLGFAPTSAIGGGMVYGSGPKGALTGEDVRLELARSDANRRAQQEAVIMGAQAAIRGAASKRGGALTSEQANLQLKEMVAKSEAEKEYYAKYGKGKPVGGISRAERNFAKWKEENPAAAAELELRQKQEVRLAKAQETKESRAERAKDLRSQINEAIKSGQYPAEVIAQLKELKSVSYQDGADVDAIFAEAKALFDVATSENAAKLKEEQAKEARAKEEWDRRLKESEDMQQRMANFRSNLAGISDAEKLSGDFRRSIENEIRNLRQEIEKNKAWLNHPEHGPNAQITNQGLENEIKFLESQLSGASTAGGMQEESFDATGEPEGKRARSQDGSIYVVRNGRWVRE